MPEFRFLPRLSLLRLALLMLVLIITGCASTSSKSPKQPLASDVAPSIVQDETGRELLAHFRQWQGTPYAFGGQSKAGIDCSGYIQLTYQDVFDLQVPRTTAELARSGIKIAERNRTTGDLLVFNTGYKQRHVGIYLGEGQFIHASTSSGVRVSSLYNPYWSTSYRQTRRLVP